MAVQPWRQPRDLTYARKAFGTIAPHFADITDRVLFGDVWQVPALSPRDRNLTTITCLIVGYRHNELAFHIRKGLVNGRRKEEIVAAITQIAFYAGWPPAMTALPIVTKIFEEEGL